MAVGSAGPMANGGKSGVTMFPAAGAGVLSAVVYFSNSWKIAFCLLTDCSLGNGPSCPISRNSPLLTVR